jgi:hypothetical protein
MIDRLHRTSLQSILALDAATCAVMAVLLVFASERVSGITLVPAAALFWAVLSLLPIAAFIAFFARMTKVAVWAVHMTVLGHERWVMGSVALPGVGLIAPNALGPLFLIAQAAVVAVFASLERSRATACRCDWLIRARRETVWAATPSAICAA